MVQVKRILSAEWQRDRKSIEDKINEFLADKHADQIIDIQMDFGNPDSDYVAAYIYYVPTT